MTIEYFSYPEILEKGMDSERLKLGHGVKTTPSAHNKQTTNQNKETLMYLIMAYVDGQWGIVGFDPHEHCAVMLIHEIDEHFGEGTAYVVKLPDREHKTYADHTSRETSTFIAELLDDLQEGRMNLDEELRKLDNKK